MNSKIPVRSIHSKPRDVSGSKNEEGKENKLLLRKTDKKNLQNNLKQEVQQNFKDGNKNFVKKNKDSKQLSSKVLNAHESNMKSDDWQPPKIFIDKASDFSLRSMSKKPLNPISNSQTRQNPVSNGKDLKKPENPKSSANHPSQPDIEFVPDENCRNRILNGRELSPSILQWHQKRLSSLNGRFSIFNKPISTPLDPHKAMLKLLENLKVEERRSLVRKHNMPSSPLCRPLDKIGTYPPKTPNEGLELAMKRLSDLRLKEKSKSAKKVTFKLPATDWASKRKERKQEIDALRLSDMSEKSEYSSQHSTPELHAKLLSNSSCVSEMERRTTISSFGNVKSRVFHQDNAANLPKVGNVDRKLSSILKNSNPTGAHCNERRVSRALDFGSKKLRRSLSASELNHCPSSNSATLNDESSKFAIKKDSGESNQIGGSDSSHPSSSNICNFNALKTSVSSPELSNRLFKAEDVKLGHCVPSKPGYNEAAADFDEKRMSRILALNFWSKKPRRSMSASELRSSSVKVQLKIESPKFSNQMDSKKTNQVGGFKSPQQSSNVCSFNMLRPSNSTPELSDRFVNAEDGKLCNPTQNAINADKMSSNILSTDNTALTDYDERRRSEIMSSCFKFRKLRRSMSVSELDLPSIPSGQTVLKKASSKCLTEEDAGRITNPIGSSPSSFPSPGTSNLGTLRTSISSPELREIFPFSAAERKPENSKALNPLFSSQKKAVHFRSNNLSSNSVKVTEPRGSLYLSCGKSATRSICSPKLCTPCPVSFNPRSRVANSFSPEFLDRRTSNIVSHAPIRTPLVMRHLAKNNELDDDYLSPVRQKLDFETIQKDKEDSKGLSQAYLQSFKTQQVMMDLLADQECCIVLSLTDSLSVCSRALSNPIANTLDYGDEMHFVPLVLQ